MCSRFIGRYQTHGRVVTISENKKGANWADLAYWARRSEALLVSGTWSIAYVLNTANARIIYVRAPSWRFGAHISASYIESLVPATLSSVIDLYSAFDVNSTLPRTSITEARWTPPPDFPLARARAPESRSGLVHGVCVQKRVSPIICTFNQCHSTYIIRVHISIWNL